MIILKKSIKIQVLGLISFGILTALSTLLLMVTPLKETWSYAVLITDLILSCFFVGVLEGRVVGKRGLISGIAASFVLLILILCIINSTFDGDFKPDSNDIILTIPLFIGAIGGVVGTNTDK